MRGASAISIGQLMSPCELKSNELVATELNLLNVLIAFVQGSN